MTKPQVKCNNWRKICGKCPHGEKHGYNPDFCDLECPVDDKARCVRMKEKKEAQDVEDLDGNECETLRIDELERI
jgi:hypothetical protein